MAQRGGEHIIGDNGKPVCGYSDGSTGVVCGDCIALNCAAQQEGRKPDGAATLAARPSGGGASPNGRVPWLISDDASASACLDISVILGTVNRPALARQCVEAVQASLAGSGLTFEIVVALGRADDPAVPWLATQGNVRCIDGGMNGAIEAFNRAYIATRGLLIAQINDDQIVEGKSIAIAAHHLYANPETAGVVFRFRRGTEREYRNEYLSDRLLHPNQIVARRSTCEAVIERIGAFWGDAAHRTDKTYGGDSAFGVICHHLGLRLESVDGVTCHDIEVQDDLRLTNRPAMGHGDSWRAMYRPLLDSRAVASPADPDRAARISALDPVEGKFPAMAPLRRERVLHLHLSTPDDPQAGLVRALRGLGDYAQIDWPARNRAIEAPLLEAANWLRPTLVFMQLQAPGVVDPGLVARLRPLLAPGGVIASWCGDIAGHNSPWAVDWQVPLGRAIDLTLHSSFTHVKALRAAGIAHAAYLQIAYDQVQYQPYRPNREEFIHDVVFLGNRYYSSQYLAGMRYHDAELREAVINAMGAAFGSRFGLYGSGHSGGLGVIALRDAHAAYHRAKIGLNVSLVNSFDCYSSDRIFRILGCGALLLTKRFPLMSVYGLRHGENCLAWDTPEEAVELARVAVADSPTRARIATAGAILAAAHHTWQARQGELAALVAAVRGVG